MTCFQAIPDYNQGKTIHPNHVEIRSIPSYITCICAASTCTCTFVCRIKYKVRWC